MAKKRPSFRKPKIVQTYASAEELFSKLPNRVQSHGYLRGPQVDALRAYENLESKNVDIAFELPTGTGKTTVGLLIAEWRRRRSQDKVAFLSLTNQLARQVLIEAERLGIKCADLTGSKETREPAEEGRYRSGKAVGITTYSNLFNINPVIQPSDVLIFDDSHGGARYAIDMWTVKINTRKHFDLYGHALTTLRTALTDSQYRLVTDESEIGAVELVDVHYHPEVLQDLTSLLDNIQRGDGEIYFPWRLIRNKLHACLFFVSINEIVIRPLVPPTHTHPPFCQTGQRIYMSATLEGVGDLERSYGVTGIKTIQAQHAQWGKRYIFLPGLCMEEEEAIKLTADVWEEMTIKRGLLIAPSFKIADNYFDNISSKISPQPAKLTAKNIEDTLDPFTKAKNALLCLAGRYDGLDLPGDDCRLLLMVETPAAVGAMENHLRSHWRLGPLLRRLERTRLIQGMGRCTRDATDFAIIIMLGQSLINSATTSELVKGLPEEIQKELHWGIEQGEVARGNISGLKEMILGLLSDSEYRKEANESLEELKLPKIKGSLNEYEDSGKSEVKFAKALWAEDFSKAKDFASDVADHANHPDLSGYRAWWWYLTSFAASHLNDQDSEIEALRRARVTGVNSGFLDKLILKRKSTVASGVEKIDNLDIQAESIWNRIEKWGWQGPSFEKHLKEMTQGLMKFSDSTQFHIGLQRLGECIGAEVLRPTEDGDPDVIWIFQNLCSFTFEAKSGKKDNGFLSKKNIQQAKGHPDWLRKERHDLSKSEIKAIIVSPSSKCHKSAMPHVEGVNYISPDKVLGYAKKIFTSLKEIRTEFVGKEYGSVRPQFKVAIKQNKMNHEFVEKLLSVPLSNT